MNQRIRQLMIQADYPAPEMAPRAQLLAELIVRECGNYMNSRIPGNIEVSATVAKMKQHLGVEE